MSRMDVYAHLAKYRVMHCMKGGIPDGDICHYGDYGCECSCQKCQDAEAIEHMDNLRWQMDQLEPELLAFIKAELMKEV